MKKKQGRFFTDGEGRVRYMGDDCKAKAAGSVQLVKTETAPQRGEKGNFITKDGKVIFIGGPGSGGGSSGGEGVIKMDVVRNVIKDGLSDTQGMTKDEIAQNILNGITKYLKDITYTDTRPQQEIDESIFTL